MRLFCLAALFACAGVAAAAPQRVLFVGNSLTYTNDLPALVRVLAQHATPPVALDTDMLVIGGGTLAQRVRDGVAQVLLTTSHYDVLVLQERGGVLACMELPETTDSDTCRAAVAAHRTLAATAHDAGVRVLLYGTWSLDARRQRALSTALRRLAAELDATPVDVGRAFCRARRDETLSLTLHDASRHPTLDGSLLAALLFDAALGAPPLPAADVDAQLALYPPHSGFTPDALVSQQAPTAAQETVHIARSRLSRLWRAAQRPGDDCQAPR